MEIHQQPQQVSRAKHHIDWLERKFDNVSHHNFSTGVFDGFVSELPKTELKDERLPVLILEHDWEWLLCIILLHYTVIWLQEPEIK